MRAILDTHTFLWWAVDDQRLSERARALISEGENEIFVSAVSGWEIAIKSGLGHLDLPSRPEIFISDQIQKNAFSVLPIQMSHAVGTVRLPAKHKDPFDRLLVVQAKMEGMAVISGDRALSMYDLEVIW